MELPMRMRASKERKPHSSMSLHRLSAEGVTQIKDVSFHLKRSGLKEGLFTSNDLIEKKIPHSVLRCLAFN